MPHNIHYSFFNHSIIYRLFSHNNCIIHWKDKRIIAKYDKNSLVPTRVQKCKNHYANRMQYNAFMPLKWSTFGIVFVINEWDLLLYHRLCPMNLKPSPISECSLWKNAFIKVSSHGSLIIQTKAQNFRFEWKKVLWNGFANNDNLHRWTHRFARFLSFIGYNFSFWISYTHSHWFFVLHLLSRENEVMKKPSTQTYFHKQCLSN